KRAHFDAGMRAAGRVLHAISPPETASRYPRRHALERPPPDHRRRRRHACPVPLPGLRQCGRVEAAASLCTEDRMRLVSGTADRDRALPALVEAEVAPRPSARA